MTSNFGPQPGSPISGLCKQPLTEPLSVTSFLKGNGQIYRKEVWNCFIPLFVGKQITPSSRYMVK